MPTANATRCCPRKGLWLFVSVALLLVTLAVLLSACDLAPAESTAAPIVPTHTPGPVQPTPAATDEIPAGPSVITLTVWTTEAFSPTQTITEGQILAQQIAGFEAAHPDVRLDFVVKKAHGKGGILDFLLTSFAVVPDLLPDLVVIDVDEMSAAVQAEILQPLDDLVPADLVDDLYPFARNAASFDGNLYALQFWANLDHLVYNSGQLTVPPSSWPGVLSNPGPYLFPAAGQAGLVNDDFLIQYTAVRGEPAQDEPFLEEASLAAVLQFYKDGTSRGVFAPEILTYHSTDDSWNEYLGKQAALTHVSAHRYLMEREQSPVSVAAPVPAINGAGNSIGHGWALALVATDPMRQSLAADLMTGLMAPETNAAWNQAAKYLPTRQAALALWEEDGGYTRLLGQLLEEAQRRPRLEHYTQVAAALQEAVENVLSGAATPEEAALEAVQKTQ